MNNTSRMKILHTLREREGGREREGEREGGEREREGERESEQMFN